MKTVDIVANNAAMDICRALQLHDWDSVNEILYSIPSRPLPNVTLMAGKSALHIAALSDAPLYLIATLIQSFGVESASMPDKFGNMPLHLMAMTSTSLHAIDLVARAYPSAIVIHNSKDRDFTPMDHLFNRGGLDDDDGELVEGFVTMAVSNLLIIYPDAINDVDSNGCTILQRCLRIARRVDTILDVTRILLAKKKQLTEMADKNGATALLDASGVDGGGEIVKVILQNSPKPLWTAQDNKGRTALHLSIYNFSSLDVVLELVQACPDLVQIQDLQGMSPIDYSLVYGYCGGISVVSVVDYRQKIQENLDMDGVLTFRNLFAALCVAGPHAHATFNGSRIVHAAMYTRRCPMKVVVILLAVLPQEIEITDLNGNLPIHIAAQIKPRDELDMMDFVEVLVEICRFFPDGARKPNLQGKLPLTLMIGAQQPWHILSIVLGAHPAAVLDQGLGRFATCTLLSRLETEVRYRLLRDAPFLLEQYRA